MKNVFHAAAVVGGLLAVAPSVGAQAADAPPLVGVVRDTAGTGLGHVEVLVLGLDRATSSDASGRFVLASLPPGIHQLYARVVGYAPARRSVQIPVTGDTVRATIVMRPATVQLATIQVTATRFASDPLDVTQSTVELSGQELNRNLAANVAQTLEKEPGLATRYNGPAAAMPVIRGLTGDRVLVLQNGERVGDLAAPTPDHALTVDPLSASSIEVVRGPAALLYGSNALGGVINVITRDIPTAVPNHVEGQFSAQGESVNPGGGVALHATAPLGRSVAATFGGHYRRVSDVRMGGGDELANSFARESGARAGLGWMGSRASGGFSAQRMEMRYGLPVPAGDPEALTIEGRRTQIAGRTDLRFDGASIPFVRIDATGQWYEHDEIEPDGAVGTHFELNTQTLSATARTRLGNSPGAFGASGFLRQYAAAGDEALTPAADSRSFGVFAFQDVPLAQRDTGNTLHLHLGARYDHTRVESEDDARFGPGVGRNFGTLSGSVGLVMPLGADATLNANVARAFRAPTVEELFSNGVHAAAGTYDRGDPTLDPETNTGGELVLRVRRPRVTTQVSAFYNRIDKYITADVVGDTTIVDDECPIALCPIPESETFPLVRYVQADANLRGIEGEMEAEIARGFVLGVMGDVVRGRLRDGTPLPFMPAARLGASARVENRGFETEVRYRHGFAQRNVPPPATAEDPSAVATDAYDLVDLSVGYTLPSTRVVHSVTLRVDNVFDERYRDATSRIKQFALNPGRNFAVVYRVLF